MTSFTHRAAARTGPAGRRMAGVAALCAGLLLACAATAAAAQEFPSKLVRIVVPFSAGGVADLIARGIASDLSKTWGQPVVVENKPGASTIIGSEAVAKAAPDGYTLLMANDPSLSSNQYLFSKLPYDPVKDFAPVINIVSGATVFVAGPALKGATLAEFLAAAKDRPGEITYGTFGPGSSTHLTTEELSALAGIQLNHIPYKGIADVVPAVLSGQIHVALSSVSPVLNLIRSGKLKALAYAGATRSKVLPDVPTFREQGIPFETRTWFGFVAPAGTPRAVIDKIAADTHRIISTPEFDQKYVTGVGLDLLDLGPQAFADFLQQDRAVWAARARRVNVRLD
ncbi:MAG: tripartite tricarboxylate transporter substrate binding protein [Pigmentiphaga sp.]|uniref:Bug family tripartite tricarboxylate transporter substrate binding protein n=1 Tax=Pigmentiphaga sp. TaxID=1977564 RepID=UPI0029A44CD5|nr:tripartite tricarboxylate transporter substrate binding protein [Pigmentiphaga sp.]MDX3907360.1 tripartite tricarboxylate transporter substrate binding protein [Pigmentiphaga sp.]